MDPTKLTDVRQRAFQWWLKAIAEATEKPSFFGSVSLVAHIQNGKVTFIDKDKREKEHVD